MKKNIFNIAFFCLEMLGLLVILILSIMFSIASIHNMNMLDEVKDFISRATFSEQLSTNDTYYYVIETDELDEAVLNNDSKDRPILGAEGDIFLMPQSRMDFFPMFPEFVSYLFGGHAGVVIRNGSYLVEAMGGSSDQSYVLEMPTDLYEEERTVVGLRVVASIEERRQAAKNAISLIGKPYNYLFVLNTVGHYYCTDVCSRSYGKEFGMNYQIDTNGFHVSLQDLFRSKDTQITYVKYKLDGKTYIYYLHNPNLN